MHLQFHKALVSVVMCCRYTSVITQACLR